MARVIIHEGLAHAEFIGRATSGFERVPRGRRALHARLRGARDRRPGRGHPRGRPGVRPRRPGDDLLDARDHRAPQRRRQRPRPDQPRAADRARRPLRQRPQPAARPEQRPGRRRHGRAPRPAAGVPVRRARPGPRALRVDLGLPGPVEARLAPVEHVRGDGSRRAHGAVRPRREPAAVGGGPAPRRAAPDGPRPPRRPGHLPDRDGGDRRRRAAGRRGVGGDRGHGHELRAAGPARAQGEGAARRGARRPVDPVRGRPPARSRLGRGVGRAGLGRAPHRLARSTAG